MFPMFLDPCLPVVSRPSPWRMTLRRGSGSREYFYRHLLSGYHCSQDRLDRYSSIFLLGTGQVGKGGFPGSIYSIATGH